MSSWVIETHDIYIDCTRSYHISYYWEKCEGYCVRVTLNTQSKPVFKQTYATKQKARQSFVRQVRKARLELEEHEREVQQWIDQIKKGGENL